MKDLEVRLKCLELALQHNKHARTIDEIIAEAQKYYDFIINESHQEKSHDDELAYILSSKKNVLENF